MDKNLFVSLSKPLLMASFDYISELKTPSLFLRSDGSMPSPIEIETYLSAVEKLKQDFLSNISDKEDNILRACLGQIKEADKSIESRGFIGLKNDAIASAMIGRADGAESFLVLKSIDSRLHTSAQSTIAFIESLLGEEVSEPIQVVEPIENHEDDTICGVKGLADFLKCGTTKAQAIINSKILTKTKPAIQYNAGGWRFNRGRLQEFISNNPDAFRNIKCPH